MLFSGMHRKSLEVAQHYGTNDSSDVESSNDYTDPPKKPLQQLQQHQQQQQQPNNNHLALPVTSAQDFAAAAAAAAAVMNSEDFRSHSIAALRARAQQHQARLQNHPSSQDPLQVDWTPSGSDGGGDK